MPLISVVMPVYNGEKFLAEAIDSILAQTYTDFEFIIVDDGSKDHSTEIINDYAKRDPRVRLVQLAENSGVASARNAGIAAARGKYIASMDSDDISLPERLRMQAEFLEANPKIDGVGVGGKQVHEDLSPIFSFRLPQPHCLIVFSMLFGESKMIYPSVMIKKELIISGGGVQSTVSRRLRLRTVCPLSLATTG